MVKTFNHNIPQNQLVQQLESAIKKKQTFVLTPNGISIGFITYLISLDTKWMYFKNPIPYHMICHFKPEQLYSLSFDDYILSDLLIFPHGLNLRLHLPESAHTNGYRQEVRASFENQENTHIEIKHPYDSKTVLRKHILDLSSNGLSFRTFLTTQFCQPGRILNQCRITVQGKEHSIRNGQIVYVKKIVDLTGDIYHQVGLKFIN